MSCKWREVAGKYSSERQILLSELYKSITNVDVNEPTMELPVEPMTVGESPESTIEIMKPSVKSRQDRKEKK